MQTLSNTNTIFAAFSQKGFRRKLELFAAERDCQVFWAEHPADLVAIPWFVAIVDRRVLGDRSWCLYEQYRADIREQEHCILVDDGPPSNLALQQVPALTDSSEEALLKVIRAAHDTMLWEMRVLRNMNEALRGLYVDALRSFHALIPGNERLSSLLLLEVTHSYLQAQRRLLVVGQQTRGWGNCSDGVDGLLGMYTVFEMELDYLYAPFWLAANHLHKILNPSGPDYSFLWSNLVKVDLKGERPTPDLEEQVCRLGLLQAEIRVTQPDVVVFFTGPDYDDRLRSTFPGVEYEEVSPFLSKLTHVGLPRQTYRTYHPNYLWRAKAHHVLEEIGRLAGVAR